MTMVGLDIGRQQVEANKKYREQLIKEYGMEVILRCECVDIPSHFMEGRAPTCPRCGKRTEILFGENWEDIRKKYPR